jgi:hypothetical protein
MLAQNVINHVVLVLDASSSMGPHQQDLIRVADGQVKYLARRSQELGQETRVSLYSFADANRIQCLAYDVDVLRLPSIATMYRPNGMTALIDATIKALDDLSHTATLYGDHAFLTFVLTDGQENASRQRPSTLMQMLGALHDNWTVAVLVPDQRGKFEAQGFGFPKDNIAIWDPSNAAGVQEAGETIRRATENFMTGRATGVRGTRNLFSTGVDAINRQTVTSTLTPLRPSEFNVIPVGWKAPIKEFVESRGFAPYQIGKGYYQLMKPETIQPGKKIVMREKATGKVYAGNQARDLIGLPDNVAVRVKPEDNPEMDIFVQSTSVNRNLIPGTDVLVLR